MNDSLQANLDPAFIEEAVFLLMRNKSGDKLFRDFCSEKEGIYQQDISEEERDQAFKAFYKKYFRGLGLEDFFRNIGKDFPQLDNPEIRVVVKRVWHRKQEEAELYVQPHQKTVYMGILVRRVLDLGFLESFLRHELTRISDMLALDFQYSPHPALGGKNEIEDNLIRDRFHVLWDAYIDARLRGKGHTTIRPEIEQAREINEKFFFLHPSECKQIIAKLNDCKDLKQMDLLRWAGDPRSIKILGEGGLRCPLCDFTSFNPVAHWDAEKIPVVDEIKKDYPHWEPEQGICPQCFDLYGLKSKAEV